MNSSRCVSRNDSSPSGEIHRLQGRFLVFSCSFALAATNEIFPRLLMSRWKGQLWTKDDILLWLLLFHLEIYSFNFIGQVSFLRWQGKSRVFFFFFFFCTVFRRYLNKSYLNMIQAWNFSGFFTQSKLKNWHRIKCLV